MLLKRFVPLTLALAVLFCPAMTTAEDDPAPIEPKEKTSLFNGKDFTGFYTYMKDTMYEDPRKIFTVVKDTDGTSVIRVSGDGYGGFLTKNAYKNYHLTVEYRWGTKTWAPRDKATRDSGILVHCMGPDGGYGGVWPSSIECQLIEGGTGDLLVVPGKDAKIPPSVISEIDRDRDGEMIWKKGGKRELIKGGRVNWYGRDPDWKDELGFRGKVDVESPGQEWTKVECIADGDHLTFLVNGKVVNEAFEAKPSSGKLCFQTEGAEVFFRKIEIAPVKK
jgi:hypothetical protein